MVCAISNQFKLLIVALFSRVAFESFAIHDAMNIAIADNSPLVRSPEASAHKAWSHRKEQQSGSSENTIRDIKNIEA
jgi:hypothetical protein